MVNCEAAGRSGDNCETRNCQSGLLLAAIPSLATDPPDGAFKPRNAGKIGEDHGEFGPRWNEREEFASTTRESLRFLIAVDRFRGERAGKLRCFLERGRIRRGPIEQEADSSRRMKVWPSWRGAQLEGIIRHGNATRTDFPCSR